MNGLGKALQEQTVTWKLFLQVCAPFQYDGGTLVEAYLALVCPGRQLVRQSLQRLNNSRGP